MRPVMLGFAALVTLGSCTESPRQYPVDGGPLMAESGVLVVEAGLIVEAGLLTDAGLVTDAGLHTEAGIVRIDGATVRPDTGPLTGRCTAGVCWEAPWPQGNWLSSVWGTGPTEVIAVGAVGAVVRFDGVTLNAERAPTLGAMMALWGAGSDDLFSLVTGPRLARYDGALWTVVEEPTLGLTHPLAVWGTSATDVFAAGSGGMMTHFDGQTWTTMPMNTTDRIEAIWGTASDQVWAVSLSDHLWHYDGTQWKEIVPDIVIDDIPWAYLGGATGVYASSPSDLHLSGRKNIYHFDGTGWTSTELEDTGSGPMWGSGPTEIYALRTGAEPYDTGRVWRYDGTKWEALPAPPVRARLSGLWGDGAGTIYVVGDDGLFARYSAGFGWQVLSRDHGGDTKAIWGTSPTQVFAGRADGSLLQRQGTGWVKISFAGTGAVNGLWGISASSVYAACADGLWRYDGSNWIKQSINLGEASFHGPIWGRADDDLYAVADVKLAGSTVATPITIHYDGQAWKQLKPPDQLPVGIWGFSSGELFTVGNSGSVRRFDGTSWQSFPMLGATLSLSGVWGSSAADVYAVGTHMSKGGQIFHYDGSLWKEMTIPEVGSLSAVWGRGATEVYAVGGLRGNYGVLLHYDGSQWQDIYHGIGQSLEAVWGVGADDLFLGGWRGAILHKGP